MAIVFWEGHLLLFVRYMVIIFQSIKRLYLAQLATCTKVKESDSPPSLWSQRILMCRCSGRMAEGPRKELRGSERGRYSSPCVLSPGSLWSISVERKHSYTLHQSLPVSSRLNLPWPSAVPFFFSAVTPLQQWSAFCPRSCQREASVLFCMELQYVQMLQAQNPERQLYSGDRNPQTQCVPQTTQRCVNIKPSKAQHIHLLSILLFWTTTLTKYREAAPKKKKKISALSCNFSKKVKSVIYSRSCCSKPYAVPYRYYTSYCVY